MRKPWVALDLADCVVYMYCFDSMRLLVLHFEKQHRNNVKSIVCCTFTDLGYIHCRSLKGKLKEEILFFELLLCMFCTLASNCKKNVSVFTFCVSHSQDVYSWKEGHTVLDKAKKRHVSFHVFIFLFFSLTLTVQQNGVKDVMWET